jgi:hypothetical protein
MSLGDKTEAIDDPRVCDAAHVSANAIDHGLDRGGSLQWIDGGHRTSDYYAIERSK